ncbi:MAG: DUF192 domain-containing protein [Burkholderiaceae bacterium]
MIARWGLTIGPDVVVCEGRVLLGSAYRANNFIGRFLGLMLCSRLAEDEALWLSHCRSVHTFGMRFAIDVLFLDAGGTIARIVPNLTPGRFANCPGAHHTVELASGAAGRLQLSVGQTLVMQEPAQTASG